ncbi:MAG TPA: DUF6580 family putative transport protein [Bacteroidota bacterium]|nr:DUF6580 family putative transport protein [Bacteroidota bacterium]
MRRYVVIFALILLAAFSRLIPHPANFTPITAIALFSAAYLGRRIALIIPVAALLLSDYVIGFYGGMFWVYGSFLAIAAIGFLLRNGRSVPRILGATLSGSVLFFVVTNFGVWYSDRLYPRTGAGLAACYAAGIPFFRNTLAGDLFFVTSIFGLYYLAERFLLRPTVAPSPVND